MSSLLVVSKKCGHSFKWKKKFKFTVFGEEVSFSTPKDEIPGYCPECFSKMIIKCAWCGKLILPGSPITLYTPGDPAFVVPKHTHVFSKDPLQLVGCLYQDCAECGGDRAGFWVVPGEVWRVPRPEELFLLGYTGSVFVKDLADMKEANELVELYNEFKGKK